jgi:predicted site-specific integrase-resolvase
LERQAGWVAEEAGDRGVTLDATVTEVGSGVHGDRAGLWEILAGPRIIVVNQDGVKDDLVRDMTRGRGRRCVLAAMVAGPLVAALRRVSGVLPPRW